MEDLDRDAPSRTGRWGAAIAIVAATLAVVYLGSLLLSLKTLADAAKSGNGGEVIALTDMDRLRGSLRDQIVDAYLKKTGGGKPINRLLANTYGASVADALLAKFLTADNLTAILRKGTVSDPSSGVSWELSPLTDVDFSSAPEVVKRLKPIQIREMEVRTSGGSPNDEYSAITLHMEGVRWKLSGIKLPPRMIEKLAGTLPTR